MVQGQQTPKTRNSLVVAKRARHESGKEPRNLSGICKDSWAVVN